MSDYPPSGWCPGLHALVEVRGWGVSPPPHLIPHPLVPSLGGEMCGWKDCVRFMILALVTFRPEPAYVLLLEHSFEPRAADAAEHFATKMAT